MQRSFLKSLVFLSLLPPLSAVLATPETYTIDPQHTHVLWHISHFGFSNPSGKWMAEGTLTLDEEKPQNSKVNITIHVGDMITGNPKLDEHLKAKLFFDVAQYPKATFTSEKVDVTGKKTAKVHGILTLHGVSKPLTLDVTLNQIAKNPISNKMSAGFSATTRLKRSDFGINALLPGLGDEVNLQIEAEAYRQ